MTTLSHTAAREYIQQLADGEPLHAEAREALNQHLAGCAECRAYAQEIKALHAMLAQTFRARWEHPSVPHRPLPYPLSRPARAWIPLAQVMVMVTMTVLVASLLPGWSGWPAAPPTPWPTETVSAPAPVRPTVQAVPDAGVENPASPELPIEPSRSETKKIEMLEAYPFFLNDPGNRAVRVQ
jgi:anti-sigma factor RsiW